MKAIDVHAHLSTEKGTTRPKDSPEAKFMEEYYRTKTVFKTEEEMAQDFIKSDVKGLIVFQTQIFHASLRQALIHLIFLSAFHRPSLLKPWM